MSSSLKTGSETTYFSLAQLPRSRSRQRSLQKGKSDWTALSVAAWQLGHLCFIAWFSSSRRTMLFGHFPDGVEGPRSNVFQHKPQRKHRRQATAIFERSV